MTKYWWMIDGLFAPIFGILIYFLILFWRYKFGVTFFYHFVSF
jgi:hypothetical protein